jgi:hypothetical protein
MAALGRHVVGTVVLKDGSLNLGTVTFSLLLGIPGTLTSSVAPTLETPKFPGNRGNADKYPSFVLDLRSTSRLGHHRGALAS